MTMKEKNGITRPETRSLGLITWGLAIDVNSYISVKTCLFEEQINIDVQGINRTATLVLVHPDGCQHLMAILQKPSTSPFSFKEQSSTRRQLY